VPDNLKGAMLTVQEIEIEIDLLQLPHQADETE
jgi:hypothetical protein